MAQEENLLTKEGLEKLRKELADLKNNKLPKTVERLSVARGQGDLSENSEYTSARDELAFIEDRISELEKILKNAKTLASTKGSKTVSFGSKIILKMNGKKVTFFIVSEFESDPLKKKISPQSPIGRALIGKKRGETVLVETPNGKFKYKILAIE